MATMVASGNPQPSNTPPAAASNIFFNGQIKKSVFNQNSSSTRRASQETKPKRKLYRCTICGNAFTRWQALGGHKNIHRRYSAEVLRAIQPEMSSPLPQGPPELSAAAPRKTWLRFRPPPEETPVKSPPKRRLDPGGGAVLLGWGNSSSSAAAASSSSSSPWMNMKKTVDFEMVPAEVDLELRLGPNAIDLQLRLGPTAKQFWPVNLDPPE